MYFSHFCLPDVFPAGDVQMKNKIYVVSGDEATNMFYMHRSLDPHEGRKASQFLDLVSNVF